MGTRCATCAAATLFTYTSPDASEIRDGHGVAASAASLRISAREHSQTRQSVGDGAKKSKQWCVLVHFGASTFAF